MSWPDRMDQGRRKVLFGLSVGLAGLLSACGFQPLYGEGPSGELVLSDLAQVKVASIPDRPGQILHNGLVTALDPENLGLPKAYRLETSLTEIRSEAGVREDETATRSTLNLTANFTLYRISDGKSLYGASAIAIASYDILDSGFATDVALSDVRLRSLQKLVQDIRRRLAGYFQTHEA